MENPVGNKINWVDILLNGGGAIFGTFVLFWIRELFAHNVIVRKPKIYIWSIFLTN